MSEIEKALKDIVHGVDTNVDLAVRVAQAILSELKHARGYDAVCMQLENFIRERKKRYAENALRCFYACGIA